MSDVGNVRLMGWLQYRWGGKKKRDLKKQSLHPTAPRS